MLLITVSSFGVAQQCKIIYVTPTGDSTGVSGTKSNPANLAYGLSLADSINDQLRLASGFYSFSSTINMINNVSIEGGYNDSSWVKSNAAVTVIFRDSLNISTSPNRLVAISCVGVSNFRLQDLTITVANAVGDGVTTYGIYLDGCSDYSIVRCNISAGNGADGFPGIQGVGGINGADGMDGETGDGAGPCCTLGGLGGDSTYAGSFAGGAGGNGGARGTGSGTCDTNGTAPDGLVGLDGLGPVPGIGGAGGAGLCPGICQSFGCDAGPANAGFDGTAGGNGNNGALGLNGTPGLANFFMQGTGLTGQDGEHGSGGGGGGGGGSQGCLITLFGDPNGAGAGGGGGGEGGQGGFGGTGGGGGGGSFGVYIFANGANSHIKKCSITVGVPGNGNAGAQGGLGALGGAGGLGNSSDCDLGDPGDGEAGGKGGDGGFGGAGANGMSANIYQDTTGIPLQTLELTAGSQPNIFVKYTGCLNSAVVFSTDTFGTISWDFGMGSLPSTCNGSICTTSYSTVGRKEIILTIDTMLYTFTDYIRIDSTDTVTNPTIIPFSAGNLCAGDSASFTSDISASNYLWIIQNGIFTDTVEGPGYQTLPYQMDSAGTYLISLTTENACCGISSLPDTISVTVDPVLPPEIVIQSSDSLNTACEGAELSFVATLTNADSPAYEWLVNGVPAGTDSMGFSSTMLIDTDLVMCVVVNDLGCAAGLTDTSNKIVVTIDPVLAPVISIESSDSSNAMCEGDDLTFNAIANNPDSSSYQWYVNGLPVGANTDTFPSTSLVDADKVMCTIINNSGCATGLIDTSNIISVNVVDLPVVSFQGNPLVVIDPTDTVYFTNSSTNATIWEWYFGDSLSLNNFSSLQNPSHYYANNGLYNVKLIAFNTFGCSDTLTIPNYILVDLDTGTGGVGLIENTLPFGFAVFPNPASDYINLLLNLVENENVELSLFNIEGKEMLRTSFNTAHLSSNHYRLDLKANEISEGIYIIDLIYKDKHYYHKILIDPQY